MNEVAEFLETMAKVLREAERRAEFTEGVIYGLEASARAVRRALARDDEESML